MSSQLLPVSAFLDTSPPAPGQTSQPLDLPVLVDIVRGIAERPSLWKHRVQFTSANRWWTQLIRDENVDVWLLSWLTTQETEFHDHGGSAAAFTVVQGALAESRIGSYGAVDLSHVEASSGSVQWVGPGVIHDVSNPFAQPAVSIHAYSPPLSSMTYYGRTPDGPKPIRTEPVIGPERR
jgi:mannose-6-phosphate isomerase-like protein (cupin superfamily)